MERLETSLTRLFKCSSCLETLSKITTRRFCQSPPFSSSLGADHMMFSWHGHVSNKMAATCSGKRRRYPPLRSAMMFRFVWEGLSARIVWIFASGASLWHYLVVESHVHHAQSCAFPRKHERMWQTTEVSPKINNLASNGHVPHAKPVFARNLIVGQVKGLETKWRTAFTFPANIRLRNALVVSPSRLLCTTLVSIEWHVHPQLYQHILTLRALW